jgi:hypothetical protein
LRQTFRLLSVPSGGFTDAFCASSRCCFPNEWQRKRAIIPGKSCKLLQMMYLRIFLGVASRRLTHLCERLNRAAHNGKPLPILP